MERGRTTGPRNGGRPMIKFEFALNQANYILAGLELLNYEFSRLAANTPSDTIEEMYDQAGGEVEELRKYISNELDGYGNA